MAVFRSETRGGRGYQSGTCHMQITRRYFVINGAIDHAGVVHLFSLVIVQERM